MTLKTAISKTKRKLINKWNRYGPYENFGQKEVRDLEDKYNYLGLCWGTPEERRLAQLIRDFDDWCMNYTGK
jgi:hypothetical protein